MSASCSYRDLFVNGKVFRLSRFFLHTLISPVLFAGATTPSLQDTSIAERDTASATDSLMFPKDLPTNTRTARRADATTPTQREGRKLPPATRMDIRSMSVSIAGERKGLSSPRQNSAVTNRAVLECFRFYEFESAICIAQKDKIQYGHTVFL